MIVTLLTDFGTADSYIGEVKGVLLSGAPGATLVDVTNEIAPGDIRSAAYILGRTWHRFPTGTIHLVVVDPGVGSSRAALTSLGQRFAGMPHRLAYTPPHREDGAVVGEVVYVDRFGSLVTNLTADLVPYHAKVEIDELEIGRLQQTYNDVATGSLLAYIGSGGAVEIAVRDGSAARRLGVGMGERVRARLD